MADQRLGLRLFRDGLSRNHYRLHWTGCDWKVYHCGRWITDPPRVGDPTNPGPIIDYLREVHPG
jgi:hypothetical protein